MPPEPLPLRNHTTVPPQNPKNTPLSALRQVSVVRPLLPDTGLSRRSLRAATMSTACELQTDGALTSYVTCTYNMGPLLHVRMLFPKSAVPRGLLRHCYGCLAQTGSYATSTGKNPSVSQTPFLQSAPNTVAATPQALPAPPEDGGPIPSTIWQLTTTITPVAGHPLACDTLFWLPRELHVHGTQDIRAEKIPIHVKKEKNKRKERKLVSI